MKKIVCTATMLTICAFATAALADSKGHISGKVEFEKHCAVCHADGGNVINPAKTLKKADRQKNGVKTWKDIVGKMRNPGPGMTKFEKKDVSDKEAKEIAEYVLKTF